MINADTVSFVINPFITNFFDAKSDKTELSANTLLYYLKNENILSDILKWEIINHRDENMPQKSATHPIKNLLTFWKH